MLAGGLLLPGQCPDGSDPEISPSPELIASPIAAPDFSLPSEGRVLGIIPDNKIVPQASVIQPLTTREKFNLAFKDSIDPFTFASAGFYAGISQLHHDDAGYGLGAAGYSKRFAASYGDQVIGNYFTEAVFPTLLHQDPRYFRKGTGSKWSRFQYAVTRTIITRTDTGKRSFNYSEFFGNAAAASVSSLYYPASERSV